MAGIIVRLILLAAAALHLQEAYTAANESQADIDWAALRAEGNLPAFLEKISVDAGASDVTIRPEFWREWWGKRTLAVRTLGLQFFYKYPDDPRRLDWLAGSVNSPPIYFADLNRGPEAYAAGEPWLAEIDWRAKREWEEIYYGELRPEFFASSNISSKERAYLRYAETFNGIWEARNVVQWRDVHGVDRRNRIRFSLSEMQQGVLAVGSEIEAWCVIEPEVRENLPFMNLAARTALILMTSDGVWREYKDSGMGKDQFIDALKGSPNEQLRRFGEAQAFIQTFGKEPLSLSFTAMTGQSVSLERMRGQVVLIDFWATWCGSCVADMPALKRAYEKYGPYGFEIIGVSMNDSSQHKEVQKLLSRLDIRWPQFLDGDEKEFAHKFGITAVPVQILINKEGRIVEYTVSAFENLEELLENHLRVEVSRP